MKIQIIIELIFMLIAKNKVTVKEITDRFGISRRTAFRYIDAITLANIPLTATYGRNGGYYIPDDYKLRSTFFTQEELKLLISLIDTVGETVIKNKRDYSTDDLLSTKMKLKEKLSALNKG